MKIQGVTESVTGKLREEIITGRLAAGSRLNETDLSERLGVSRPPLREAFRKLENESLVHSVPRKGCFVADMSVEDCEQIYRARLMIEGAAIEAAARQAGARFPLIRKSLEAAAAEPEPQPPVTPEKLLSFFYAVSDFHMRLVESANNKWLTYCYSGMRSSLARYQVIYLILPGSPRISLEDHQRILQLMENGDTTRAKREMKEHLNRTRERLLVRICETHPRDDGGGE